MQKIIYVFMFIILVFAIVEAKKQKSYWSDNYDSTPKEREYKRGGEYKWQDGYFKNDGKYVKPHYKTYPDEYDWNNKNKKK